MKSRCGCAMIPTTFHGKKINIQSSLHTICLSPLLYCESLHSTSSFVTGQTARERACESERESDTQYNLFFLLHMTISLNTTISHFFERKKNTRNLRSISSNLRMSRTKMRWNEFTSGLSCKEIHMWEHVGAKHRKFVAKSRKSVLNTLSPMTYCT